MAITYTWTITALQCITPDADNDCDTLNSASWKLTGTDGTYSSFTTGSTPLNMVLETIPGQAQYDAYNALTEAEIITALQTALGGEQIAILEAILAIEIQKQNTPATIIYPPLPWVV